MKNVNSKGKEISIMNFAIYTLHFALKSALFQRAKLFPCFGFGISGRGCKPLPGESPLEDLSS
jgi:hypothetical protein